MSAATSSRSSATWSRSASASSATRKRKEVRRRREQSAEERVLDALVGAARPARRRARASASSSAPASSTTRRSRSRCATPAPDAVLRDPRHAGASVGMINIGDMLGKAFGSRTKTRKRQRSRRLLRHPDRRGSRQAARPGRGGRSDAIGLGRERRHRLPRRDRQDLRPRRAAIGADVSPRGRAARPAAADRGHHGRDQVRAGEDRPHPVHRLGRLPRRQAVATCCPSCRAACRSASSSSR